MNAEEKPIIGAASLMVMVLLATSLGACSSKRKDGGEAPLPPRGVTTTVTSALPDSSPLTTTASRPAVSTTPPTLPDSVPERIENAYDYETIVPVTTAVLPTVVLAPLGTSPAERLARTPPTTGRIGSVDNDVAAAAPDTRIPTRATLATPAAPPPLAPLPTVTVPDLGLDATAAERILAGITWPQGLAALPGSSADVTGNAVANTFAGDRTMRAAMRSGAGRLLQRNQDSPIIATVVLLDAARLGTNPLAVVRRSMAAGATAANDLVDGKPAIALRQQGSLTLVILSGDRLVGVAGSEPQEALVRDVAGAILRAT